MMEIPAGKWCWKWCDDDEKRLPEGEKWKCPFLDEDISGWDSCWNPSPELFGLEVSGGERMEECLSAYPNGATIVITPKEVK